NPRARRAPMSAPPGPPAFGLDVEPSPGPARGSLRRRAQLVVAEQALAALADVEHAGHAFLSRFDAEPFEAPDDVRAAAHRPDADALLEADHARGHAAVDGIGECPVALAEGLDHRRGVHPG